MITNTAAQQLERIKILLIKAKKETDFVEIINLSHSFFKEEFFNPEILYFQELVINLINMLRRNPNLKNSKKTLELLNNWLILKERKIDIIRRNFHLKDIPQHPDINKFYVKVLELNPTKTLFMRHVINDLQVAYQRKRTNKDLISFDESDPITGYRRFGKDNKHSYPGSEVVVKTGHHRLNEIYRRYLEGRIDGETLIIFVKTQ